MKILLIKPETVGIFSFTYLVEHEPLEMEYLYTVFKNNVCRICASTAPNSFTSEYKSFGKKWAIPMDRYYKKNNRA